MVPKMRFDRYVGFVSPPAAFDYSAQQFRDVCASPVGVVQNLPYDAEAEYGPVGDDGGRRLSFLRDGIMGLRAAEVEIVAQFGGYWAMPYTPTATIARELQSTLSEQYGVSVLLNFIAIADALTAMGAKRISVTTGYYRPAWTDTSVRFFESAGFEILWAGNIIDQGLVKDEAAMISIEQATRWDYPTEMVHQTCVEANHRAPDCDVVLQLGGGMRTHHVAAAVEAEITKPFVATDIAMFWAVMKEGGLVAKEGFGRLLSSLESQSKA